MGMAVENANQSTYCSCCNRVFNSLQIPRHINTVVPVTSTCQDKMDKVLHEGSVGGPNWTSAVRPDVKLASHVHFVTCHSCKGRLRNPPSDYVFAVKKTNDVVVYGALLGVMGDTFHHRYSPDHR